MHGSAWIYEVYILSVYVYVHVTLPRYPSHPRLAKVIGTEGTETEKPWSAGSVKIGMEKRQHRSYSAIDVQVSCGCAVLIVQLNSLFDPLFSLVAWLLKTFDYLQRNMRRVLTEAPAFHLLSDNPFFCQVAGYTAMCVFRVSVCGLQGWCIWMKSRSAFVSICLEHKSVASRGVDA